MLHQFKLLTIIGARPQFVKAAAVSRILQQQSAMEEIIIHTGQHYDPKMSAIFFEELDIPKPNYNLEVGSGSHAEQTGRMLIGIEKILLDENPDYVIIYGDTNSTIAGALAAAKLHIPVAHVEAGLRSFNREMPEEINRIASDHISDVLYAPTQTAMENLEKEGLINRAVLCGDVMYDSIEYYKILITDNPHKFQIENRPDRYYLATVHRPSNTDNQANLLQIFQAFSKLDLPVVFPAHPRVKKIIESHGIQVPTNVLITDPVGYLQMLNLLMDCQKVFTDSGGVQKEAYILKRPCITLRKETEWVETTFNQWNILTGPDANQIIEAARKEIDTSQHLDFYGDGYAAHKIISHLISIIKKQNITI